MNEYRIEYKHMGSGIPTNRVLVSADMGQGYEELNDPRMAYGMLEQKFVRSFGETVMLEIQSRGQELTVEQREVLERTDTVALELAWLQGNNSMIRKILAKTTKEDGGEING
jgi:hypothetical protein